MTKFRVINMEAGWFFKHVAWLTFEFWSLMRLREKNLCLTKPWQSPELNMLIYQSVPFTWERSSIKSINSKNERVLSQTTNNGTVLVFLLGDFAEGPDRQGDDRKNNIANVWLMLKKGIRHEAQNHHVYMFIGIEIYTLPYTPVTGISFRIYWRCFTISLLLNCFFIRRKHYPYVV